jgi:integrase
MAFVEKRGQWYRVVFRHEGQRYTHTLKTQDQEIADGILGGVQKTLMLLKQHVLRIPVGADVLEFVLSGGQVQEPSRELSEVPAAGDSPSATPITLQQLQTHYVATLEIGSVEANSLDTVRMHLRHFVRTLGADFPLPSLSLGKLQEHVALRAKAEGVRKRPLSPTTIRKEIASLRAAWNWGVQARLVSGPFPNKGLKYPKSAEKPPFQTWQEIERQLQRDTLDETEQKELWDCLFLSVAEIDELLVFVKETAIQPWVYPMFCFAAHTGARRSEMLRARIADLDLEGGTVRVHEKKRVHGRQTSRRIPLSPFLSQVLREWLTVHPGGPYLFTQQLHVFRSKKRSHTTGHKGEKARAKSLQGRLAGVKEREQSGHAPLTKDEAHDHFKRTLAESKWSVLRGWHVFRHSFASNAAMKGIDQRVINSWLGHQTEEMVQRYRHLFPDQERHAINLVFGKAGKAQAS